MASNSAQSRTVTPSPFSLNDEGTHREGAPESTSDIGQLSLSPRLDWQEKGTKIRTLLNRAIVTNQITMPEVERNTGIDEKQAARSLKEGGGAHPPLALVAYLLWNDEQAVILRGIASMLGFEVRRNEALVYEENRRLRTQIAKLRAALAEDAP